MNKEVKNTNLTFFYHTRFIIRLAEEAKMLPLLIPNPLPSLFKIDETL